MTKISDEIRIWIDRNIRGSATMTRNTDAYNHMLNAADELLRAPWAQQEAKPYVEVGAAKSSKGAE